MNIPYHARLVREGRSIELVEVDEASDREAVLAAFGAASEFGHSLWRGRHFLGYFELGEARLASCGPPSDPPHEATLTPPAGGRLRGGAESTGVARRPAGDYASVMGTRSKIVERWRYLRGLLMAQLEAFEKGAIEMHSDDVNISPAAIAKLKRDIAEFDALLAEDEASEA